MPTTSEFEEAYGKLNGEQKEAVEAIQGPVFVIAGPGTGKTQILTLRIANILQKTDTPPDAILALTFTESAAHTMRERLATLIGTAAAWRVRIHTFHGFAQSLIERFPDAFPRIIGGQIATDAERAEILDEVLLNTDVKHLRPYGDPLYYHPYAARAIETLKRENVTPPALLERIEKAEKEFDELPGKFHEKGKYEGKMKGEYEGIQKKIEKTRDLLSVYTAYEEGLTKRKRYDFADLILEAVRALREDESMKRQVQEQVLYTLADEHQDANASQNALLELLSDYDESPNLFIVGDEKQAIYRFQGADLDNVHYFRSRFSGTTIIALVDNYRSTQTILDSALSLIAASADERLSRVPLQAHSAADEKPLTVITCDTPEGEMAELAARVQELIDAGTPPEEIAIFGRRNRDVSYLADHLVQAGIPAFASTDGGALTNRYVRGLLRLLRAVAEPVDERLAGVLSLPAFPLAASDAWRVMRASRTAKVPALSLMSDPDALTAAGVKDQIGSLALAALIEKLARFASIERPAVVAEEALRLSGILPQLLAAPDRAESLSAVRALLHTLEDISKREHDALLSRALLVLDLLEERGISLATDTSELPGRVKVMTVHKAKGREFSQVFIPRLTESAWSTRARPEHFYLPDILSGSAELEDERRLLYVAITRAKEHATISYSLAREDGRPDAPSALIESIDPALMESVTASTPVEDALLRDPAVALDRTNPSKDDLQTLRAAFLSQGLSPTALNNYLECPWKYFYVNLLRIPEAENKFMLYGTAIHAALHRYALSRGKGTIMSTEELTSAFGYTIGRAPLSERDLAELMEKGKRSLSAWWQNRLDSWPTHTEAELAVDTTLTLTDDTELLVRGKLDRMDGDGSQVTVIDYKTGKARSRNEIMGQTKEGNADYYRQLTFYKMLLARSTTPRVMREGVLEFVEPDDKGRIRSEAFEISDTEVQELEALIQKSAKEILALSFWNDPCNESACPWCAIRFGR